MSALLTSFTLVFISEMGDKTQLLALVLAARFKRPWVIMAGILVATLLNHGLASYFGGFLATWVSPQHLRFILSFIFIAFAIWILIPDREDEVASNNQNHGVMAVFLTTTITFFLSEMGDKTQLATVALGARFASPIIVTLGTTLGMLGADGLAVFFGTKVTSRLSMQWIRRFAATLFFLFGLLILLQKKTYS